jgi:hypothetical protein
MKHTEISERLQEIRSCEIWHLESAHERIQELAEIVLAIHNRREAAPKGSDEGNCAKCGTTLFEGECVWIASDGSGLRCDPCGAHDELSKQPKEYVTPEVLAEGRELIRFETDARLADRSEALSLHFSLYGQAYLDTVEELLKHMRACSGSCWCDAFFAFYPAEEIAP